MPPADTELTHYRQRIPRRKKNGEKILGMVLSANWKTLGGFSKTAPKTPFSSPSVKSQGHFFIFDRFSDPHYRPSFGDHKMVTFMMQLDNPSSEISYQRNWRRYNKKLSFSDKNDFYCYFTWRHRHFKENNMKLQMMKLNQRRNKHWNCMKYLIAKESKQGVTILSFILKPTDLVH